MVKRYAGVAFRCSRRVYCFEIGALHLKVDDVVVVETDRGVNLGQVVVPPEQSELPEGVSEDSVKKVLRKAREDDFAKQEENLARELDAARLCREKIVDFGLDMKLVRAELMHDSNRIIFYFTAENRVDFRDLVKELAHQLRLRVEMRQIGIRDAAGMIGGIGVCGRELCCALFLTEFVPVTVKMAKEQNLALNPMKISGICGRLMCCLGYEYENYRKSNKRRPRRVDENKPAVSAAVKVEEKKAEAPSPPAENQIEAADEKTNPGNRRPRRGRSGKSSGRSRNRRKKDAGQVKASSAEGKSSVPGV